MSIRARVIITILLATVVPLVVTQLIIFDFDLNRIANSSILFLDLVAIIFALLFSMMMTSHFTLSLGELMHMAQRIQQGEYPGFSSGGEKDELSQLGRTLSQMTEKLKDTHRDLIEKSATLSELLDRDTAILRSINEGLIVTHEDRSVIFANETAARLLGWQADEFVGKRWPDDFGNVTTEEGKIVPMSDLVSSALFSNKNSTAHAQYRYPRKNKNPLLVAVSASKFSAGDGENGVVVVFRDITREKEIDKAKTEFVSLASHQLRTPLSTISWYSEVLLDEDKGQLDQDQRKYLEEIYKGNRRMIRLVNALLDVSRLEMGKFDMEIENVNVSEIAKETAEEFKLQCEAKNLQLLQNYEVGMPLCEIDTKIVRIIVQNLLSNAIKYTPADGSVSLRIKENPPGFCSIVVRDTGYGIPSHQKDKIFSKLFRADNIRQRDTEGTGLGLYIIHSMVTQLGGTVKFESEENQGTTFTVTFPLRSNGISEDEKNEDLIQEYAKETTSS